MRLSRGAAQAFSNGNHPAWNDIQGVEMREPALYAQITEPLFLLAVFDDKGGDAAVEMDRCLKVEVAPPGPDEEGTTRDCKLFGILLYKLYLGLSRLPPCRAVERPLRPRPWRGRGTPVPGSRRALRQEEGQGVILHAPPGLRVPPGAPVPHLRHQPCTAPRQGPRHLPHPCSGQEEFALAIEQPSTLFL